MRECLKHLAHSDCSISVGHCYYFSLAEVMIPVLPLIIRSFIECSHSLN